MSWLSPGTDGMWPSPSLRVPRPLFSLEVLHRPQEPGADGGRFKLIAVFLLERTS